MSDTATLREITRDNEASVSMLAVAPGQDVFVDDQPVGFVMLSFDSLTRATSVEGMAALPWNS